MTISDANWNSATDPFRLAAPSFSGTPTPSMVAGNLRYLTFPGTGFLSGIVDDEKRQVVVLVHDTDGSVEHFDSFHLYDDRTDPGATEFHTYYERYRNTNGDYYSLEMFAGIMVVSGSSTCLLDGVMTSFPNNTYRVRVTRYPAWRDDTLAQIVFGLGQFIRGELAIWDENGFGDFYEPRDFMDKDSFQTNSDKANHHRMSFIAQRDETVEHMIMRLIGQTADYATIRPSDTDDGWVGLHLYHHEDLPTRSEIVLTSDTLESNPHVLSWDLRTNVVEPVTGLAAQFGHYHVRRYADTQTPDQFLNNDFPLDYKTGEDRFVVGINADRLKELEFPNSVLTGHGLASGGILAQFPIYTKFKSQDELSIEFDWYGNNYLPGDLVYVHLDGQGWDETSGEGFVVIRTEIADAVKGVVRVTMRRAWGIGNPHPYDWRDASTLSGSEPSEDWPFLFSAENIRLVAENASIFGSTESDFAGQWFNTFAHVRETGDYSSYEDEHMIDASSSGNGALLKSRDDANAPYGWPSVWFLNGGKMPAPKSPPGNYGSGDALLWWVWRFIDTPTSPDEFLIQHTIDANNAFFVKNYGGSSNRVLIEFEVGGVQTQINYAPSQVNSEYVICRLGGTSPGLIVNGSFTSVSGWTAFPGLDGTDPVYFGTDSGGANPINCNVAEIGCVMPQSAEDVDDMYDQLVAYLGEKFGI